MKDCSAIYKWLKVLYTTKTFAFYHGWTQEMVLILFRETEHGRLSKVFAKSIENYHNTEDYTDLELPMGDIFTLIFSNITYKK